VRVERVIADFFMALQAKLALLLGAGVVERQINAIAELTMALIMARRTAMNDLPVLRR